MRKSKRKVSYDGSVCKVRSDTIEIPDFKEMDRMAVLIWLNRNTYPTGNGIRTQSNPLQGLGGIIGVKVQ